MHHVCYTTGMLERQYQTAILNFVIMTFFSPNYHNAFDRVTNSSNFETRLPRKKQKVKAVLNSCCEFFNNRFGKYIGELGCFLFLAPACSSYLPLKNTLSSHDRVCTRQRSESSVSTSCFLEGYCSLCFVVEEGLCWQRSHSI